MDYVGQLTLIYKATCRKFLSVKFIIVVFTVVLLQAEIFKKRANQEEFMWLRETRSTTKRMSL